MSAKPVLFRRFEVRMTRSMQHTTTQYTAHYDAVRSQGPPILRALRFNCSKAFTHTE